MDSTPSHRCRSQEGKGARAVALGAGGAYQIQIFTPDH